MPDTRSRSSRGRRAAVRHDGDRTASPHDPQRAALGHDPQGAALGYDPERAALGYDPQRRRALRGLGLAAVGAVLAAAGGTASAQMDQAHQHGHGAGGAMGMAPASGATPPPPGTAGGRPAPHAIPWMDGRCAFCDMTLATPEGAPQGAGFRERTYAQWAFAGEARHFESIGCALGWAYAHGVLDGEGAALYLASYDQAARPAAAALIAGHDATFLWAERLPASMRARVGAFARHADAAAFVARRGDELGRRRFVDLSLLVDLSPLPIANLVPLLQRQLG